MDNDAIGGREDASSSTSDVIALYAEAGDTYWPIAIINLADLREQGFGQRFMLRYTGQIDQLNVQPPECAAFTPQEESPEQSLNSDTGGNPGRTVQTDVETVTVFFAAGQSNG